MKIHPGPATSFFSNLAGKQLTEQNLLEARAEFLTRAGKPLMLVEPVEIVPPSWPYASPLWRAAVDCAREADHWGNQRQWAPRDGEAESGLVQDHLRWLALFLWLLSLTDRP